MRPCLMCGEPMTDRGLVPATPRLPEHRVWACTCGEEETEYRARDFRRVDVMQANRRCRRRFGKVVREHDSRQRWFWW